MEGNKKQQESSTAGIMIWTEVEILQTSRAFVLSCMHFEDQEI